MSVDLRTRYLGLELKNPLIVAACSLSEKLEDIQRAEAAEAAAVVLHSLFEEQIEHDEVDTDALYEQGSESFAESLTYFPELDSFSAGPQRYLQLIQDAKRAVSIPIIASLNGIFKGGWVDYARLIEDAGADALELNIYFIAADVTMSGNEVETRYLDVVQAVKESISIPLGVKVGSQFSSPGNMGLRLVEAGADGLVLLNRFQQPNIDLDKMEISTDLAFSTPNELLIALRWIAILRGHTRASLALTGGIHTGEELLKALLVGADVGMVASTLYQNGFDQIGRILQELERWMEAKEYKSVEQLKGSMSQEKCSNPSAFERGNYVKVLKSCSAQLL
jgi:dihydroorotate dehydrogenase (fumarate)